MMRRTSVLIVSAAIAASGCSIKRTAVNIVGDALSGSGGVYAQDDDSELVRDAIPFGLKTYEGLLATSPDHQGLLLAAASGFVGYAYLLGQDLDMSEQTDAKRVRAERLRVSKLFLRGRNFAMHGLEVSHPGFGAAFAWDPKAALATTAKADAGFLYWAGAGWAGAVGSRKGDPKLIADLPSAAALVGRVLEVDEGFDGGSAHEFFITYEGSRPGGSAAEARSHYRRALELSKGERASVHLALAEAVSEREQKQQEFRDLLRAALAVDPDKVPDLRLVNTIAIRRAHWLEERIPDLFVGASLTE